MIQYLYTEGEDPMKARKPIKVKLEGIICGAINPVEGGWQYFPEGSKSGGSIFATITEVQKSLRSDDGEAGVR